MLPAIIQKMTNAILQTINIYESKFLITYYIEFKIKQGNLYAEVEEIRRNEQP